MSAPNNGNHTYHIWLHGVVGLPKCVQRGMEQHKVERCMRAANLYLASS